MSDPWRVDVEPYVLGALDEPERAAFEDHLRGCPGCRAAVDEVGPLPALLDLVPPDVVARLAGQDPVTAAVPGPPAEQVPASVLARLLWSVRLAERRRARRRLVVGALAAAAVVVLALVLPASPVALLHQTAEPQLVALAAVTTSPVTASAELEDVPWGTRIELTCTYRGTGYGTARAYALVVAAQDGSASQVATWSAVPGRTITVPAATDLDLDEIATIELVGPAGETLLRAEL